MRIKKEMVIKIINRKEKIYLTKKSFLISGNICGERIRLARILQKPSVTQDELAMKINLMGYGITPLIISRIEKNQRHVCDLELKILSKSLGVSMDWLCGEDDDLSNQN